jgi:membrane-associated protease RseP (regulator of RpoE activity)
MKFRTRAFGAPLLAVALAFLAGSTLSATGAQAADRTAPRAARGGYLGVRTQELTDDLRDSYDYHGEGVLVAGVSSDSPADRLGIREGDIITRVDGGAVDSPEALASRIRSREPGTLVAVTVWRSGRERSLGRIAVGDVEDAPSMGLPPAPPEAPEAPEAPEPPAPPRVHVHRHDVDRDDADKRDDDDDDAPGAGDLHELRDIPGMRGLEGMQDMQGFHGPSGMMAFGLGRGRLGVELGDDSDNGVVVTRVLDGTPADHAGLKAGDVITGFDGHKVDSGDDLRRMVREHDAGDVEVRVERRGAEHTLTAHLGERATMNWRALPGGNGWQGWMDHRGGNSGDSGDDRDKGGAKDKSERRVYRYKITPGQGGDFEHEFRGLSPEDRAQLRKDIQQLRDDLQRMRREMREKRTQGDDEKGDDDAHDRHHDSDDDDDDSGD